MKQIGGVWLPDDEEHMAEWMRRRNRRVDGRLTYQFHKYEAALAAMHRRKRRIAIDAGAHCGTWAMHMVRDFAHVHAFEPIEAHRECFLANMAEVGAENFTLHPVALMDAPGRVAMAPESRASSGGTHVVGIGGDVEATTIDALQLAIVDLLKIDVEGQEIRVVRGAEDTLRRCKPIVVVEQKGWNHEHHRDGNTDAVQLLQSWGARRVDVISGDWIMRWK